MQEAEHASSENIDRSSAVELKGDMSVAISGPDESHFLSNPHDVSAPDGSSNETKEQKADEHSDSCKPSTSEADGAYLTTEVMAEDMMVGSLNGENSKASMSDNEFASKLISWADGSLVSLSQLAGVVHGLAEDEFSFLLAARKQASKDISGFSVQGSGFSDVLEPLKEQLYLTSYAKDMYQIIHGDIDHEHYQLVNEYSAATALLNEARSKNESLVLELQKCLSEFQLADSERGDLQKELGFVKAEFVEISTRSDELQGKLVMSQKELETALTDLADCRNMVAALQIENENMSRNLTSVMEERNKFAEENANSTGTIALITNEKLKLEEERDSYLNEYKKASTELADYKALAESLQLEKDNLKGIVVSFTEEQIFSVHETEKLFAELIEYKVIAETLQQENSNFNISLALLAEERKELTEEKEIAVYDKEKASADLALCKSLMSGKKLELEEAINNLKEAALHLERLTEENLLLTSTMDIFKAMMKEYEIKEQASVYGGNDGNMISSSIAVQERSLSDDSNAECLPSAQLELDVYDDSYGFVSLRGHLLQAGKVLHKLEKAIEEMHSQTDSLRRSSTKGSAPAVSKLIQAFESKSQTDDHEAEGVPLAGEQSHADLYRLTKEQTGYLRTILNEISVVAENAGELFKVEKSGKVAADFAFKELKLHYDALQGENHELGEARIELLVLFELIRQHVCNTEAKKDELLLFYDTLRQQNNIAKVENNELENRLSAYESRINDTLGQLDELQQKSQEMNSSYFIQMEMLHKEVSDKTVALEQKWSSVVSWLLSAVEKLNTHIEASPSNYLTDTNDENDIGSQVVASFEGATRMVDNLKEKLDGARSDYELTCSSYRDLTEKFNNLHGQHELATGLLHKIYASLGELVSDSSGYVEENEAEIAKLVDPLNSIIEQLRKLLEERLLLKSLINEINSDLINKTNKVEELNRRCFSGDSIMKLAKQVEHVVNLKGLEINMDEPALFIESLIYLLVQRYKEANDIAILCKENLGVTEMKFSELHAQVDHIILTFVHCDNENVIYKESLKNMMEDLVVLRSQIPKKVTELEQSEQRVSSLREKLSIAVAKGKGLIVQRDGLKQSLAEKSGELERCLQELQLKDAQLFEVETKLKAYSEAGERVEALESELSYIRNSATALRESFLLKDSVLHRIEEILEDLELPEHFHARDIIEKIDWLASAVTGNSLAPTDWDQKSGAGEGPHMDTWKEEMPTHSNQENESTKKYDDLQSKFYALAEQNEMLEQSLMERNNLVQRWEEILDKINMPSQLRSMEPEDRIEWLGGALSEAVHRCESLQQKVDNVETFCGSLSTDLEESRKRTSSLEAALQSLTDEKEHLSTSLEILTRDNSIVSQKADVCEAEKDKLQNKVAELEEKLEVLQVIEQRDHHVDSEIRRLQDFLSDVLQDTDSGELNLGMTSIEYLEQLLRKVVQKYTDLSAQEVKPVVTVDEHISGIGSAILGERTRSAYAEDQEVVSLSKQLEEVTGELARVKEDVVISTEKNKTLIHELEKLEADRVELRELLKQEEQKTASVREKLNMAVRKGKSLVQQRDSMRQTIDELTVDAERLRSELSTRDAALSEYEQKIMNYREMVEGAESKSVILENQLAETEHDRQDKKHTLNAICSALDEIDIDSGYNAVDPVDKIVQIGKICHGLQVATTSSEHEANKSKRAAELLLAELNEVQERNDGLQEELEKVANEVPNLAMEKKLAEAAKHEALLQVENLNALLLEKRNNQISEFAALKPFVYQLRSSFSDFINLLGDAFSKDLELVHNLAATSMSSLKSSDTANLVSLGTGGGSAGIGQTVSGNEVPSVQEEFLSASYVPERKQDQFSNSTQSDTYEFIECNLQELIVEISGVKAKLFKHTSLLHEEAKIISETVGSIHKVTTQYESTKREMFRLESIEKQKDTEIMALRRDVLMLYKACKSSATELRNWKYQKVGRGLVDQDQGYNYDSTTAVTEEDLFKQIISTSGSFVSTVADELFSAIKEIVSAQNENVELGQMELKAEIANLQRELQEKNIQKDKICFELVNQIKEAESTAMRYSQELQSANDHIHDLEKRMDVLERERSSLQKMVEEEHNRFQQKVEELKDQEAAYIDMQDRIRSLTAVLAAKEQEAEAIMQALDEEEAEIEVLKNKNEELETGLNQKSLDLLNAEASLGKTSKKLSATVRKFDELHHLSENLLSEVEKLQSQLHDRDSEVSFLRQEVTRCTNDALAASQMSKNRNSDEMHELLSWLDSVVSQVLVHNRHSDDKERNQDHEYKERLQKQIMAIITDLEDQRAVMQSKDNLLRLERNRVEDLVRKGESLEKVLQEKEAELTIIRDVENSGQGTRMDSETIEAESVTNKWPVPGSSSVSQVRSLRKSNNDQVAISVDMEPGSGQELENEDDDKAHGFKSLTTSKVVPRFTRPVTDLVDGLWVSCDRALMRQPALRLGVIMYWFILHALVATFAI